MNLEEKAKKLDFKGIFIGSIVTALGLVAGIFWKDAMTDWINEIFPSAQGTFYKFILAIFVTLFIVVIMFILYRMSDATDKLKERIDNGNRKGNKENLQ